MIGLMYLSSPKRTAAAGTEMPQVFASKVQQNEREETAMSIHTDRAREIARENGGYAGLDCAAHLWKMSKRELIEIALRFGERIADDFSPEGAVAAVNSEYKTLNEQKII